MSLYARVTSCDSRAADWNHKCDKNCETDCDLLGKPFLYEVVANYDVSVVSIYTDTEFSFGSKIDIIEHAPFDVKFREPTCLSSLPEFLSSFGTLRRVEFSIPDPIGSAFPIEGSKCEFVPNDGLDILLKCYAAKIIELVNKVVSVSYNGVGVEFSLINDDRLEYFIDDVYEIGSLHSQMKIHNQILNGLPRELLRLRGSKNSAQEKKIRSAEMLNALETLIFRSEYSEQLKPSFNKSMERSAAEISELLSSSDFLKSDLNKNNNDVYTHLGELEPSSIQTSYLPKLRKKYPKTKKSKPYRSGS